MANDREKVQFIIELLNTPNTGNFDLRLNCKTFLILEANEIYATTALQNWFKTWFEDSVFFEMSLDQKCEAALRNAINTADRVMMPHILSLTVEDFQGFDPAFSPFSRKRMKSPSRLNQLTLSFVDHKDFGKLHHTLIPYFIEAMCLALAHVAKRLNYLDQSIAFTSFRLMRLFERLVDNFNASHHYGLRTLSHFDPTLLGAAYEVRQGGMPLDLMYPLENDPPDSVPLVEPVYVTPDSTLMVMLGQFALNEVQLGGTPPQFVAPHEAVARSLLTHSLFANVHYVPILDKGGCVYLCMAFVVAYFRGLLPEVDQLSQISPDSLQAPALLNTISQRMETKTFVVDQLNTLLAHPSFQRFRSVASAKSSVESALQLFNSNSDDDWSRLPKEREGASDQIANIHPLLRVQIEVEVDDPSVACMVTHEALELDVTAPRIVPVHTQIARPKLGTASGHAAMFILPSAN